jgi:hypothetical protein
MKQITRRATGDAPTLRYDALLAELRNSFGNPLRGRQCVVDVHGLSYPGGALYRNSIDFYRKLIVKDVVVRSRDSVALNEIEIAPCARFYLTGGSGGS